MSPTQFHHVVSLTDGTVSDVSTNLSVARSFGPEHFPGSAILTLPAKVDHVPVDAIREGLATKLREYAQWHVTDMCAGTPVVSVHDSMPNGHAVDVELTAMDLLTIAQMLHPQADQ